MMNKYCTLFSTLLCFVSIRRIGSETPRFTEGEELLLFDFLSNTSHYDSRQAPTCLDGKPQSPLVVKTSMFVYFIGNFDAQSLQFETHLLFRHRWRDDRLNFTNIASFEVINGEDYFTDHIWTPNIFIENSRDSTLMRTTGDSTYVRILNTGEVELHYRLKTVVLCDMKLQRFPHDTQNCTIKFESWSEPSSEILLEWESEVPIGQRGFSQPEYRVLSITPRQCISTYHPPASAEWSNAAPRKISGKFSTLMLDFILRREIGHYVLEYYIPSLLLVAMSWVGFWLDPNAVPGRTTLGTATWLTLITLTRNTGSDNLPKVNYVKFIDIWFLVCTIFIFSSLLEFAIVNTIWRRKDTIHIKKLSSRRIIREGIREFSRSAFSTPSISRRNSVENTRQSSSDEQKHNNQLTITSLDSNSLKVSDSFPSSRQSGKEKEWGDHNSITINVPSQKEIAKNKEFFASVLRKLRDGKHKDDFSSSGNTDSDEEEQTMSYEEIAIYVDTKARIIFPALFMIFNLFYWILAGDMTTYQYFTGDDSVNIASLG